MSISRAEAEQMGRAMDLMLQGNANAAYSVIAGMLERRSAGVAFTRHAALQQLEAGDQYNLHRATTAQLLDEIRARIDVDEVIVLEEDEEKAIEP